MTPPTTFGPWMPAQNRMDWSEATIVPPMIVSERPCRGTWMILKMSSGNVVLKAKWQTP